MPAKKAVLGPSYHRSVTSADLLRELRDRDIRVLLDEQGRPILDHPPGAVDDGLMDECVRYRWVLLWGLEGERRGLRWHGCSSCGSIQLSPRNGPCHLTDGCSGMVRELSAPAFVADDDSLRQAS